MSEELILALDQGTTSSRAMLIDTAGRAAAIASEPLRQIYPKPGWVEHDAEEIWRGLQSCIRRVLDAAGPASAERVAAAGITNQRETLLIWQRSTGRPLHPAIVWQDRRTAERCEKLREQRGAAWVTERTGLLPDPYFSATKLEWLLQLPEARRLAEQGDLAAGTIDSWLLYRLTAGRELRTDRTNASRTMLWNLREERWDPELLEEFEVPSSILPTVSGSADRFGQTDPDQACGVAAPICGIAGDQQAALFGQGGWAAGMAKNTYGTGCFLLLHTGDTAARPPAGLLSTAAACEADQRSYALEGSVFTAGAVIQWLRDELGMISSAEESETLAAQVADTGGVYLVPAFAGLGTPYWDPRARGTICGLTRGSGRCEIVRAALESIAYQTADVVQVMTECGLPVRELRVDGGASANNFLMQFQADLLGAPVRRAACQETTALGAAYLAGLGAGIWSQADLENLWKCDRTFEPRMSRDERQARLSGWRRAVERSRGWAAE